MRVTRAQLTRAAHSVVMASAVIVACGCSAITIGGQGATSPTEMTATAYPNPVKTFLYLGSCCAGSKFKIYPIDGSKPVRQFSRRWGVRALELDRWNDIYTGDGSGDEGQIIAYAPGGVSILLTINANTAQALAFDGAGNLYVADSIVVEEYAARSTKLLRLIRRNTKGGDALAFDGSGNLYVGRIGGSVEVFAPGASRRFRSITDGVRVPYALLFARSGNLLVANCPSCYGSGHFAGSVTEYAPGKGIPLRTLTKGINAPIAMALGRQGLVFVANHPFLKQGSVTVYSSGMTPVRTITDGINGPDSLAVDSDGYLYVANWCGCGEKQDSITVYSPDGSRLLRTITQGVVGPSAIAIGKE